MDTRVKPEYDEGMGVSVNPQRRGGPPTLKG